MQLLEAQPNVRDASMFPRDMTRLGSVKYNRIHRRNAQFRRCFLLVCF